MTKEVIPRCKKVTGKKGRYKGVQKVNDRWRVLIQRRLRGTSTVLYSQYYATELEAARAYDEAARQIFGKLARLNFPNKAKGELKA
jgi:hypothetical protein